MKKVLSFVSLLVVFGMLTLFSGCGGGGGSDPGVDTLVANAGADQNVVTGAQVTLDGSASHAAQGETLTYLWTATSIPTGSSAALIGATTVRPTFTADVDGEYTFSLVVNDGVEDSSADSVIITATAAASNSAPGANAGSIQNVKTGDSVTLDGSSSSDADGDTLTYTWAATSIPTGSSATLSDETVVNPTFTPDIAGDYIFSLVVNDGQVDSAATSVTITASTPASNSVPLAKAGPDQTIVTGTQVTLDGISSYDADNEPFTYLWTITSVPASSSATLSDATIGQPTFTADVDGDYVFSLVVNDGQADSIADSVTITAKTLAITTIGTVSSLSGRTWMDRNLGASRIATSITDSEAYGDLYQWGRGTDGHEKRNSLTTTTLSNSDTPGHGKFIIPTSAPGDWRSPQNDNLWQGVNGVNNPCPTGFRLPTKTEWEEEPGYRSFDEFSPTLKLTSAGFRNIIDGAINFAGTNGSYASSTVVGTKFSYINFSSFTTGASDSGTRAHGYSVRCIKD